MQNQTFEQTPEQISAEKFNTVREDVTRALGSLATLMENTDDYDEFKRLKTKRGALGDVLNTMEDMEKADVPFYSALYSMVTQMNKQGEDAYNSGINLALDYIVRIG